MKLPDDSNKQKRQVHFQQQVQDKAELRLKAKQEGDRTIWYGLGMFGIVGWSVAIPTLLGIALGIWLDSTFSDRYSWTLMMLLLGILIGCLNAWYWIQRQSQDK
jgi:ATP synthase protein I